MRLRCVLVDERTVHEVTPVKRGHLEAELKEVTCATRRAEIEDCLSRLEINTQATATPSLYDSAKSYLPGVKFYCCHYHVTETGGTEFGWVTEVDVSGEKGSRRITVVIDILPIYAHRVRKALENSPYMSLTWWNRLDPSGKTAEVVICGLYLVPKSHAWFRTGLVEVLSDDRK